MKESIVGTRQGIYDVLYECDYKSNDNHRMFHVKCSKCGFETNMIMHHIKYVKNCQHTRVNGGYISFTTRWNSQRIKRIFSNMVARCYDTKCKDYITYGARGITIYSEWLANPNSFEDWCMANGYTDDLTIDRIDSSKGYYPENCRWISRSDNAKYKSTTRMIEVDGVSHTGRDWAKLCDIGTNGINQMYRNHGEEITKEFIRRRLANMNVKNVSKNWLKVYGLV